MYRGSILHVSSWRRLALGGQARPAHAQTALTVTNCSNDSQLQAAVAQANSDNAGDTITFACSGDILLTNTLNIEGVMTLDGSGQSVTLDGGDSVQVLVVSGSLTLNTLTVAHGSSGSAPNDLSSGGGLHISEFGGVSISNSTFAYNSAPGGGGGGIYDDLDAQVSITNSTFTYNSTSGVGGGIYNCTGGVSITNSTFAYNSAFFGGGLFSTSCYGINNDSTGVAIITNSTFAYNSTTYGGRGGGLANYATASITNSTFAYNSASSDSNGGAGGLDNERGTMSVSNSIVAYNSAPVGGNCSGSAPVGDIITLGGQRPGLQPGERHGLRLYGQH